MSPSYEKLTSTPLRILSALVFGLWLWMFLPPMENLKLVNEVGSFSIVFIGLAVGQMTPWRWLRFVLALFVTELYVVQYYASDLGIFRGLVSITELEWQQIHALLNNGPFADPLQTHVFLWCICGMYWLIAFAGSRTRLWVFYNLLAVLVLGIVDGNTSVHPNQELVVIMILFVVNLGILQYKKLYSHFKQTMFTTPTARYFTPLSILLLVSLLAAWVLPKSGPEWADPSQTLAAWRGNAPGKVVQMVGYQEDNASLGGSFIQNNNPVISMVSNYPSYLRGKVYSVYSGKGWTTEYTRVAEVPVGESFAQYGLDPTKVKGSLVQQKVTLLSDTVHASALFGAYSMQKVSGLNVPPGVNLQVAVDSDVVYAPPVQKGETYTVTSYETQNPFQTLEKLPPLPADARTAFPEDIQREYLLLPEMPDRVQALAQQIAGGERNEYQIVTAVRDYLRGRYAYDTQGIPVPGPNQDYVDQFLFDSRVGYCNNFSSAMAVMLRTLGIPTRWVTGFATGTKDPNYTGSDSRYIYKNSDAHSWVEVYFPSVGWIPFDPTPSFDMPTLPTNIDSYVPPTTTPDTPSTPPKLHNLDSTPVTTSTSAGSFDFGQLLWTLFWVVACLAVILLVVMYLFRVRIREARDQWAWRKLNTSGMLKGLQYLVRKLRSVGEMPQRTPTLRDLHKSAKTYGLTESEYRQMVQTAESHWYGGKSPTDEELQKAHSTWAVWIRRIGRRGN